MFNASEDKMGIRYCKYIILIAISGYHCRRRNLPCSAGDKNTFWETTRLFFNKVASKKYAVEEKLYNFELLTGKKIK